MTASVSSLLSPINHIHNQWILDYVPDNLGWRIAAGLLFVPNILFSVATLNIIEHKTNSRELGVIFGNLIFAAPIITIATGNPIWLIPSAGFMCLVACINLRSNK